MFKGLQESQLHGALEALLFVSDEPVSTLTLADMVEMPAADVQLALQQMASDYEQENRGIWLREIAGGWRLFTQPVFHDVVERYVVSWDMRRLTTASLETLAIVAYTQPTTRSAISSIRGVNSDSSLNSLLEKGLVREAGTADTQGNPMLYATTRVFLERFGLQSIADLPDVAQFAPDDKTRELICERLSIAHVSVDGGQGQDSLFGAGEDEDFAMPGATLFGAPYGDDLADAGGVAGAYEAVGEAADADATDAAIAGSASADSADAGAAYASSSAQALDALKAAFATAMGVTEKIDFDNLVFNTDDE